MQSSKRQTVATSVMLDSLIWNLKDRGKNTVLQNYFNDWATEGAGVAVQCAWKKVCFLNKGETTLRRYTLKY